MSSDRYKIEKKIGEGGAGSVYLALDTRLDREVAVKRLMSEENGEWNQETVDGMLKEARLLSTLEHPNIVTIYDADVDDDGPYVVMELLQGSDMDELIEQNVMTGKDFRDFSVQCLEGLSAAHSRNIIHRDIKPNNIVLKWLPNGKFQAKLLDFGMAKLSEVPSKQTVDHSDSVMGSIYFMAPEQFERVELDARTDIYALGAVFYYTLTGAYPFTGDTAASVMAAHLTHRVQPIGELRPDLPEWTCNWIMWLINREMSDRPESAQVALDLFLSNDDEVPLRTYDANAAEVKQTASPSVAKPTLLTNSGQIKPNIATTLVTQSRLTTSTTATTAQTSAPNRVTALTNVSATSSPNLNQAPQQTTSHQASSVAAQEQNTESYTETHSQTVPKSKINLVPLYVVLGLGLIIIGIFLALQIVSGGKTDRVNALFKEVSATQTEANIVTSKEDFELMTTFLYGIDKKFSSKDITKRISFAKSDGSYDVVEEMVKIATDPSPSVTNETRRLIFEEVLSKRNDPSLVTKLIPFIKSYDAESTVIQAIQSTELSASPNDLNMFVNIIVDADTDGKKRAAAQVAEKIILSTPNRVTMVSKLKSALGKSTSTTSRSIILKLIGTAGGSAAKDLLLEELQSGNSDRITTALSSIKEWPNGEMTEDLIDYLSGDSSRNRSTTLSSTLALLRSQHLSGDDKDFKLWNKVASLAKSPEEKIKVINSVTTSKFARRLDIVKIFINDKNANVSGRANKAKIHIMSGK